MPAYATSAKAPPITPDKGSGPWCSAPQTAEFLVYKRAVEFALDTHAVDMSIGPDAVAHMRHYLNNTGNDLTLDIAGLMRKSGQFRGHFDDELAEARTFCETLAPGRYAISSSRLGSGYFRQAEDRNLFFAIGGYSFWGQGAVEIAVRDSGKLRDHLLDFEFHFYDRYNWDAGKSVSVAGVKITDDFMQKFHLQCYAREFDVKGVAKSQVRWTVKLRAGTGAPPEQVRNPFDLLLQK
jgi:hypothetical protein